MNNPNSQTKPGNPSKDNTSKGAGGTDQTRKNPSTDKTADVAGKQRQQQQGGSSPRPGSSRDKNG